MRPPWWGKRFSNPHMKLETNHSQGVNTAFRLANPERILYLRRPINQFEWRQIEASVVAPGHELFLVFRADNVKHVIKIVQLPIGTDPRSMTEEQIFNLVNETSFGGDE